MRKERGSFSHSQLGRNPDTGQSTSIHGSKALNAGKGEQPEPQPRGNTMTGTLNLWDEKQRQLRGRRICAEPYIYPAEVWRNRRSEYLTRAGCYGKQNWGKDQAASLLATNSRQAPESKEQTQQTWDTQEPGASGQEEVWVHRGKSLSQGYKGQLLL